MPCIVECVPNISEGRDRAVIDSITAEIGKVSGVELLDVDPGEATNRTVITFAGDPDASVEAAFNLIAKAAELIDMSKHKGAHPRMGATDVCPFVPVAGMTMDDCVELAKRLGKRVGDELGIPVYLYEYAAQRPERRNLANCRAGEYEGLAAKVGKAKWTPDFGPDKFNARSGATAIGARDFLIAWNMNLNTRNVKKASRIANRLREKGYAKMKGSKFARDEDGNVIFIPGIFKGVKAVGWFIDEYTRAQISINITKHHESPIYEIFDAGCSLASKFGVRVTGSELVGLIPLDAMTAAGRHYLKKQGQITGVSERELVDIAVMSMGLSEIARFDPHEKIIEYRLRKPGILTSMKLTDFIDELASNSPAPGGGSVAALCGALSAALSSMAANLTFGKKGYTKHDEAMESAAVITQELKTKLTDLIDRDTEAFKRVMASFSLPKNTSDEADARDKKVAAATRDAALVPFEVLSLMPQAVEAAQTVAEKGNKNLTPDAGVAGLTAALAARGAAYNVRVNLQNLPDDDFAKKMKADADRILLQVDKIAGEIRAIVESRLWE